ncbi:MAG: hypothetical protein ACRCXD_01895 [Luteolibacter sp.]
MKPNCILLLCSILIPACGVFQKDTPDDEKPKPSAAGPQLVGRIASVPADKRFVLIQSYGKWEIESGRILTTRGLEERTANLRTTGETLGEFAAADLQSGTVAVGDAVYSQHIPKPVESSTSPESQQLLVELPKDPVSENVQKNN